MPAVVVCPPLALSPPLLVLASLLLALVARMRLPHVAIALPPIACCAAAACALLSRDSLSCVC